MLCPLCLPSPLALAAPLRWPFSALHTAFCYYSSSMQLSCLAFARASLVKTSMSAAYSLGLYLLLLLPFWCYAIIAAPRIVSRGTSLLFSYPSTFSCCCHLLSLSCCLFKLRILQVHNHKHKLAALHLLILALFLFFASWTHWFLTHEPLSRLYIVHAS